MVRTPPQGPAEGRAPRFFSPSTISDVISLPLKKVGRAMPGGTARPAPWKTPARPKKFLLFGKAGMLPNPSFYRAKIAF